MHFFMSGTLHDVLYHLVTLYLTSTSLCDDRLPNTGMVITVQVKTYYHSTHTKINSYIKFILTVIIGHAYELLL